MTIRRDADLAPATVTGYSRGVVRALRTPSRPRLPESLPVAARAVHPDALELALSRAQGDATRLWFTEDGSVWVLNHTRAERCASMACPMCSPHRAASNQQRRT
jgi:hypothetical protein